MKKLLLSMTAMLASAAAVPVAAQYQNNGYATQNRGYSNQNNGYAYGAGAGIDNRLARLDARIQAGVQSGAIDRDEARDLRQQLRDISRLDRQYARNGYTQQEREDLRQRLRTFRDELAYADGGRGGQNGQYGANGGYYGQGGPYEEVACENTNSGGLGGLIGSIFGGNNNDDCAGLRVGQRVSGNLGAVPYQYRNQYRDSGSVYYRSDGRQIYQIDARTNTVVRIFDM